MVVFEWIWNSFENGLPLFPARSADLLAFLGGLEKQRYRRVHFHFLVWYLFKQWVSGQVPRHPIVEIFDVGGNVNAAHVFLENVRVLRQQGLIDDSPLVLGLFEVGIGKEKKHLFQLALFKEARQVLHGIATDAGNVPEPSRILLSQRFNPLQW